MTNSPTLLIVSLCACKRPWFDSRCNSRQFEAMNRQHVTADYLPLSYTYNTICRIYSKIIHFSYCCWSFAVIYILRYNKHTHIEELERNNSRSAPKEISAGEQGQGSVFSVSFNTLYCCIYICMYTCAYIYLFVWCFCLWRCGSQKRFAYKFGTNCKYLTKNNWQSLPKMRAHNQTNVLSHAYIPIYEFIFVCICCVIF